MSKTDPTPRTVMTEIGGWKLGKTLGRGAYAHVRLATHKSGHTAACKILPALHRGKKYSRDEMMDAVEAHKELVLLKGIAGAGLPGVVGLEGVMNHQGWNFIFLSLYPKSASSVHTFKDPNVLVPFFRRVCLAVQGLHNLGISHEDLKRSNILVTRTMEPILADFGFSHLSPDGAFVRSLGGTADYSSPEKTRDDEPYDGRANDVFSLGILLVKLLGRQHPWAFKDSDAPDYDWRRRLKYGYSSMRWDFADEENEYKGVGHLVYRMLDPDPRNRYTLARVLKHPFLQTNIADPPRSSLAPLKAPTARHLPHDVVLDIAFLAFNKGEFALCEHLSVIEEAIICRGEAWMVQWAAMLSKWKAKAETMWEDVVASPSSKSVRSPIVKKNDIAKASRHSLRPLRIIQLSPNAKKESPMGTATKRTIVNPDKDQPLAATQVKPGAQRTVNAKYSALRVPTGPNAAAESVVVRVHDQRVELPRGALAPIKLRFGTARGDNDYQIATIGLATGSVAENPTYRSMHRTAARRAEEDAWDGQVSATPTSMASSDTAQASDVEVWEDAPPALWSDAQVDGEEDVRVSRVETMTPKIKSPTAAFVTRKKANKENVPPPTEMTGHVELKPRNKAQPAALALRRSMRLNR